jgi:ABC-type oligopeptide transport system substrate-binding subunit
MKRHIGAIGAFVLALPLLAAAQEGAPKRGGKLTFGIERDMSTMNPFVRISSTDRYVRGLFYEALIDEDAKGARTISKDRNVESGAVRGIKGTPAPFGGFRRIIFNVAEAPFNNPKLRQAIAHAIDRKQFVQGGFFGYGNPTHQRFPHGSAWYFKLPERERSPAKVKALLKEPVSPRIWKWNF